MRAWWSVVVVAVIAGCGVDTKSDDQPSAGHAFVTWIREGDCPPLAKVSVSLQKLEGTGAGEVTMFDAPCASGTQTSPVLPRGRYWVTIALVGPDVSLCQVQPDPMLADLLGCMQLDESGPMPLCAAYTVFTLHIAQPCG